MDLLTTAYSVAPVYPNGVKWSTSDLIAVNLGTIISITPFTDLTTRATISVPPNFVPVVGVTTEDTNVTVLEPKFRDIAWSPFGADGFNGCLLVAVSTGRTVCVYRQPGPFEEWTPVMDLSERLNKCLIGTCTCPNPDLTHPPSYTPMAGLSAEEYTLRVAHLTPLCVAWSTSLPHGGITRRGAPRHSLLAVAGKGEVSIWLHTVPDPDESDTEEQEDEFSLMMFLDSPGTWDSALSWLIDGHSAVLAIGSTSGEIQAVRFNMALKDDGEVSLECISMMQVCAGDSSCVTAMAWSEHKNLLAFTKGLSVNVWQLDTSVLLHSAMAHFRQTSGVAWHSDPESAVFSCGIDGGVRTFSEELEAKIHTVLTQENKRLTLRGCYGIAVSPNGLFAAVLHTGREHSDKRIYLQRKAQLQIRAVGAPSTLRAAFVHKLQHQVGLVISSDLVTHAVMSKDPDTCLGLIEDLDGISSPGCADPNPEWELALLTCKALRMSARLLRHVKLPDLSLAAVARIRGREKHIFRLWAFMHVQAYKTHYAANDKPVACGKARLSLLLLCDWLLMNAHACPEEDFHLFEEMIPLVKDVYSHFSMKRELVAARKLIGLHAPSTRTHWEAPAREKCLYCGNAVRLVDPLADNTNESAQFSFVAQCESGHTLVRCARTLMLVDSQNALHCGNCKRKANPVPLSDFPWLVAPYFPQAHTFYWLCVLCGSMLSRRLSVVPELGPAPMEE